jgi:hypothetical protein
MPRFRKKPVVIEAVRWEGHNLADISAFIGYEPVQKHDGCNTSLQIETKEGDMWASMGDWIIKGVMGEFYPCKPNIFEATYEGADG